MSELYALFDALLTLPHCTQTVLWRADYPNAEEALRLWAASHDIRLDESIDEAGHSLRAVRKDGTEIVGVRIDDPFEEAELLNEVLASGPEPTRQQLADRQLGEEIAATYRSKP